MKNAAWSLDAIALSKTQDEPCLACGPTRSGYALPSGSLSAERRFGCLSGGTFWIEIEMLDISGFLTSSEFLTQLASLITAILTAFVSQFVGVFLNGTG